MLIQFNNHFFIIYLVIILIFKLTFLMLKEDNNKIINNILTVYNFIYSNIKVKNILNIFFFP
jgi:hypothetical protein